MNLSHLYRYITCIACLCLVQAVWAQEQRVTELEDTTGKPHLTIKDLQRNERYVALDKPGKVNRLRFYQGQKLTFRFSGDKRWYDPILNNIDDSSFVAFDTRIFLSDISTVKVYRERRFLRLLQKFCFIAGVGYFFADLVNHSFTTTEGSLIVTGSFLGAGGLFSIPLFPRKYKLGKKRRLRVLEKF